MLTRTAFRVLCAACVLLFLPQILSAGDPWNEKPFIEWTEEEALKVLRDSPWSRASFIQRITGSEPVIIDVPTIRAETPGQHSTCCTNLGSAGGTTGSDALARDAAAIGLPRPVGPAPHYRVLILSSGPIRQALARLRQLQGEPVCAEAAAALNHPLEDIVVAVSGPYMTPFETATIETLKSLTWLRSKKNKRKTLAFRDFINPASRQDGMAVFIFPRTVDGKAVFDLQDEQIEFGTGENRYKIRASFRLRKMVAGGVLHF